MVRKLSPALRKHNKCSPLGGAFFVWVASGIADCAIAPSTALVWRPRLGSPKSAVQGAEVIPLSPLCDHN